MNQDEEFRQQIQANDAGEARAELLGVIKILQDENKSLRHVMSTWRKTTAQEMIEEQKEENRKLRLELHSLRFKESQEQRFIWWIWNVYSRNVCDLIYAIMGATTYDTEGETKEGKYALPKHCFDLMKLVDEYTEHIYDGTYLDIQISADVKNGIPENKSDSNQPSNSDGSETQDEQ